MPKYNSYHKGDWKVICDVCGFQYLASQLRKRWDNLMVCPADWETRQPQDFVKGVADIQAPPWARPETQDVFLSATISSAIAGYAIAGAAIVGHNTPPDQVPPSTFT